MQSFQLDFPKDLKESKNATPSSRNKNDNLNRTVVEELETEQSSIVVNDRRVSVLDVDSTIVGGSTDSRPKRVGTHTFKSTSQSPTLLKGDKSIGGAPLSVLASQMAAKKAQEKQAELQKKARKKFVDRHLMSKQTKNI